MRLLRVSSPKSNLPAFRRRDGKYHCAMMSFQTERTSGPPLCECRCPAYPHLTLLSVPRPNLILSDQSFVGKGPSISSQKRGPPKLLS